MIQAILWISSASNSQRNSLNLFSESTFNYAPGPIVGQLRPTPQWSGLDLTTPPLRVMTLLGQASERMGSIAAYLGCILSSATSMIDRLVDQVLLARSVDRWDRPLIMCRLTLHGEEEMARFWSLNRVRYVELAQQGHATTGRPSGGPHPAGAVNAASENWSNSHKWVNGAQT